MNSRKSKMVLSAVKKEAEESGIDLLESFVNKSGDIELVADEDCADELMHCAYLCDLEDCNMDLEAPQKCRVTIYL